MKSWVRNSLRAGVLAAGFLLFAAAPAHANDQVSFGNSGIASGNNVSVPIAAAVNACGNGIGVLGNGVGGGGICVANAQNESATEDGQVSALNSGIASGNNVSVPIAAAVNACGNGVGALGNGLGGSGACVANAQNGDDDNGDSDGHHGYKKEVATTEGQNGNGGGNGFAGQFSSLNSGVLSGNNVSVPIAAAVNACGNGIGVLGNGLGGSGACVANAQNESGRHHEDGQISSLNSGILSGNNIELPVALALNACGNGIGVLGNGLGGSGACVANAQNGDDDNGNGSRHATHSKKEALPVVGDLGSGSDLSKPIDAVAPVLGGSSGVNKPDVQLPAKGNAVTVPGLS